MINNIELYINPEKEEALSTSRRIIEQLPKYNYKLTNNSCSIADLTIGLGGDGTLLHWLKKNNYTPESKYIGVNFGTVGFIQDFSIYDVDMFLQNIPTYIEEKLFFVSADLITLDDEILHFEALNDIIARNIHDRVIRAKAYINNDFLETVSCTALLFCSQTGSTARNISSMGSILFKGIEAFQMTPIEPSVQPSMMNIPKSICFPKDTTVTLFPTNTNEIALVADSEIVYRGNYKCINIKYSNLHLTKLTNPNNNYSSTLRKKISESEF